MGFRFWRRVKIAPGLTLTIPQDSGIGWANGVPVRARAMDGPSQSEQIGWIAVGWAEGSRVHCGFLSSQIRSPCAFLRHSNMDFHLLKGSYRSSKGSANNKFAEFALRFRLDLVDPIEQNHRNSRLFRGFCE